MSDYEQRMAEHCDGALRRLVALRAANRVRGRDYLRRLRRATRPRTRPAKPPYRRFPPKMQIPRRTVVILGLCLLLLVVVAIWSDSGEGASRRQIKSAVCHVFGPRCPDALEVAWCESRLRPWAISPGLDVGLFQINYGSHHWPGESFAAFRARMVHLGRNIAFAFRLSRHGTSWSHWVCQP
jgi:hypothetical protein